MARQQGLLASVADSLGYSRTLTNAVMQRTWTVQQEVNTHGQSVEALGAVAQPCPHRNASADKLTQGGRPRDWYYNTSIA